MGTGNAAAVLRLALAALAGLVLAYAALAEPASEAGSAANYRAVRASALIGLEVANAEGKALGRVDDLIVDMNTGAVRYATLSFDPGLLRGRKLFAVPTRELRLSADGNRVVRDVPPRQPGRAAIDRSRWASGPGDRAQYLAGLDAAYGIVQPSSDQRAFRASELIGKKVNSRQGDGIGEIEDLVIDMGAQKVHYAVLGFDPSWVTLEKLYAFPLQAFGFIEGQDELVLQADETRLQAMESFDRDRWADLNDRAFVADIERYLATVTPAVAARAAPAAVFGRLDGNRDGFLNRAEAARNSGLQAAWDELDRNRDGRLSRAEMTSGYQADAEAAPRD